MAKKKQEAQEGEEILTSVEARRKFKDENPDEPDHPAGREAALVAAKAAAASLQPAAVVAPATDTKTK